MLLLRLNVRSFNPRTYIRYDSGCTPTCCGTRCFNPRTYIRYDITVLLLCGLFLMFQSTYLYKVRQDSNCSVRRSAAGFQSTYLYKVRQLSGAIKMNLTKFQSTYLYKVRQHVSCAYIIKRGFNPRTYIRYDFFKVLLMRKHLRFQSTYLYKVRL